MRNKWQHTRIWNKLYEVFCKDSHRLNTINYFCKKIHLRSPGSEYVSDYLEAFSIIINWGFYYESFRNFSDLFSNLLVSSVWSRNVAVRCNKIQKSRLQMSFKIGVLKNFAKFTGKHLCWSLFLINLQACKQAAGDFLWILQNFLKQRFS